MADSQWSVFGWGGRQGLLGKIERCLAFGWGHTNLGSFLPQALYVPGVAVVAGPLLLLAQGLDGPSRHQPWASVRSGTYLACEVCPQLSLCGPAKYVALADTIGAD